MSWSWKIGRIAGIPIFVHWTFLILLAFVGLQHWFQSHRVDVAVQGVLFLIALFGCVVLHELGHALAARRYGIPTSDITLLPIGGVARLQSIPEKPSQELVVALAGPAVNVVIAAVLLLLGARWPSAADAAGPGWVQIGFFSKLLVANVVLVALNMLPAFPMDGGRVLRAILAMNMPYAKATRIAATVGQFAAIGFGFLGLMIGNPFLLLIALFVWLGAESEARMVEERVELRDVTVREAMLTDFQTLGPEDTLGRAADLLLAGSQQDFPIQLDGQPANAVLTRGRLLQGLAEAGRSGRVADFSTDGLGTVDSHSALVPAMARLREGEGPCLQVVERGRPVGLLTLENVGEFLMVRAALAAASAGPGSKPATQALA